MMKVSIVTVCYNSEKHIEDAIKSVLAQSYPNIEYIIIDGYSKDSTLEIISRYSNRISRILSEPDKGIYDAMNKGIRLATGDVIAFLNSDDFYAYPEAITDVIKEFEVSQADCVFSNINYVSSLNHNKIVRYWESGNYAKGSFKKGWHPAHPAFVVKKPVYDQYGVFDLTFKLAADFDLMLRFLENYQISNHYFEKAIIHMRLGGATSGSFKNILKQNIECYKAFKKYDLKVSFFYPFIRVLPKIKQFFK